MKEVSGITFRKKRHFLSKEELGLQIVKYSLITMDELSEVKVK